MWGLLRKVIGGGEFGIAGSDASGASQARGFPTSQAYGANWSRQRQRCLERDGYRCRVCGTDPLELGRELVVHRIAPRDGSGGTDRRDSDSLDNLITLCPSCHERFEGEFTDASPEDFAERATEALTD